MKTLKRTLKSLAEFKKDMISNNFQMDLNGGRGGVVKTGIDADTNKDGVLHCDHINPQTNPESAFDVTIDPFA